METRREGPVAVNMRRRLSSDAVGNRILAAAGAYPPGPHRLVLDGVLGAGARHPRLDEDALDKAPWPLEEVTVALILLVAVSDASLSAALVRHAPCRRARHKADVRAAAVGAIETAVLSAGLRETT